MFSKLLSFSLIFICFNGISQTVGLSIERIKTSPQYLVFKKEKLYAFDSFNAQNQQVMKSQSRAIPSVFSVETLPFFCKIEYKMGLNKKFPIKFRLGDVQYVDELEGKH